MPELWDQLSQQPVAEPPSLWPQGDRAPLRITVGGPTMKDGAQALSGSSLDPFNPPQVEYVGRPIVEGLAKIFSGPSWLQRATEQSAKDQAAFQAGGVPGLMADTAGGQELAGGFGGTTTGKLAPALMAAEAPAVAPAFYSALMRSIEGAKLNKASPEQWLGYLRNQPGVKAEEIDRVLGNLPKEGMFTKPDMQAHAAENAVTLGEVNKGIPNKPMPGESAIDASWRRDENPTKYSQWQLPGGENYREKLLTLPTEDAAKSARMTALEQKLRNPGDYDTPELNSLRAEYKQLADETRDSPSFKSSHWDEPNVLAHIRMNDRQIPGVGKSLHAEEFQSDLHQQGRLKGYQQPPREEPTGRWRVTQKNPDGTTVPYEFDTKAEAEAWAPRVREANREATVEPATRTIESPYGAVPDFPFKNTWTDLALKRLIREAAEKGYDAISWTPGEAQAARYDLSKHIDNMKWYKDGDGYRISAKKNDNIVLQQSALSPEKLADTVGKDLADKIIKSEEQHGVMSGLDLKVGGEGMKAFYDKMLVDKANALGKKHGARVEPGEATGKSKTMDAIAQELGYGGWHSGLTAEQKATVNQIFDSKKMTEQGHPVHVLRITPQLREAAMKGFPLFSALFGGVATAPSLWPQEGRQ